MLFSRAHFHARLAPQIAALLLSIIFCTLVLGVGVARALGPDFDHTIFLPRVGDATAPVAAGNAAWSGTMALSPTNGALWVVNPDAGSVTVVDGTTLQVHDEVSVGGEPWAIAITPDGTTLFVADRATGTLLRLDSATHTVTASRFVGYEPGGLVLSADGRRVYLSLMAEAAVVAVDSMTLEEVARVVVAPTPYALARLGPAAPGAPEQLYVTHLFGLPIPGTVEAEDNSRAAKVTVLDVSLDASAPVALHTRATITLPPNAQGGPNLLASIAVHGGRAWLPHVRVAPALPNSMTTTVFASVATLDTTANVELPAETLPLNDQTIFGSPVNNPAAVAPSPDGRTLYLVHGGSDLLEVVDIAHPTAPRLVKFLPTGKNPRGLVLTPDGRRAYVMNYLSRSVSVYDLKTVTLEAEIVVAAETLPADLLAGKILFHNAVDPRLSRGGWVSCASCHFDGWPDGVTWFFPDGPRQSPMLWNSAQTLPWHWSAALDEAQDVEETIHVIQHGLGLAPGDNLYTLGAPLAGQSVALDQLAIFLRDGIRPARVPYTNTVPSADTVAAGRELFIKQGCNGCHGGPAWTSSALSGVPGTLDADGDGMINSALHDVGTATARDVRGQEGFDVPSLLGVGLTAPYFHDGAAVSLEAVLASGHPQPQGGLPPLDTAQLSALVAFLRSIGPETATIPIP